MIGQIAFVLAVSPILRMIDASNGYCPAPVDGTPACQRILPQFTRTIIYIIAYDSEERRVQVHEAFTAIRKAVNNLAGPAEPFGVIYVWQGQSANFWLGIEGNMLHVKDLTPVVTVGQTLSLIRSQRASNSDPTASMIVNILIEFVSDPCPSVADCQNAMNTLCHDYADYIFHVSLGSSSGAAPGYEQFSNCICSHLVQTATSKSQFCVPLTSVGGWSPTPGTINKRVSPPSESNRVVLVVLLSVGLVIMVVACIIGALAFNKIRKMPSEDASPGKVPATSTSTAPLPGQVSPKTIGYGHLTDPTPKVQSINEADVPKKKSAHGSITGPTPNVNGPIGSVVAKSQLKETKMLGDKKATLNADATKSTSKSVSITHE